MNSEKKQPVLKKKAFFYIVPMVFLLVLVGGFVYVSTWLDKAVPVNPIENRIIKIERGSSLYAAADTLYQRDILSFPRLWVYYSRFIAKTTIKAGEYQLDEFESPKSLLAKLSSADVIQYKFTIIEGSRFSEIVGSLRLQNKLIHTLPEDIGVDDAKLLGMDVAHLEGWFYPDTYYYSAEATDVSILRRAYKKMQITLEQEWAERSAEVIFDDPYEALILASIVEKETGVPYERPDIAGVFHRRLLKGMRLQTDPTVIYGMGDAYDGNITRKDLRQATAYNTYVIKGLPPTPIAAPGRAAINATLNPAEGTALYFVAKGDGTHYFSSSLDEHNRAVEQYQLNRKKNYRSSYKSE